jgi:hypothetical protein
MNWIEIDKILFEYYDKYYATDPKKFYETSAKKFGWDAKQTRANTDYIIKIKNKKL